MAFRTQHVAPRPAGWKVRSKRTDGHVLRIAFPPGRRRRGAGKILEVLHPKKNPCCEEGTCKQSNPAELVVFTNPTPKLTEGKPAGHKRDCRCPFCKRARALAGENPKSKTTQKAKSTRAGRAAKNARPHRRGRNSSETTQAVQLFQKFHGRDPKEIIEAQRSAVMRTDYTALGKLVGLCTDDFGWRGQKIVNEWEKLPGLSFQGDDIILASSPNGKQLYFIGGRQNLDRCLEDFEGIDTAKDLIDLGPIYVVVYEARKAHSKFEPTDWVHRFGEKGGELPRLVYDKLKKEMLLAGGEYFIDTSKGLSPGIED